MRLTPTERDRLLIFTAAEPARARRRRDVKLNVPEATALITDTVCETTRDGRRLAEAIESGRRVIDDPFGQRGSLGLAAPGAALPGGGEGYRSADPALRLPVRNTATAPIGVSSHFHFFAANPRLVFDRAAACGMRLAVRPVPRSASIADPPSSSGSRTSSCGGRSTSARSRGRSSSPPSRRTG